MLAAEDPLSADTDRNRVQKLKLDIANFLFLKSYFY